MFNIKPIYKYYISNNGSNIFLTLIVSSPSVLPYAVVLINCTEYVNGHSRVLLTKSNRCSDGDDA